jgi:hypothetical protein
MFNRPSQIVADTSSNLFVLDNGNARIRKVTPNGTVSTFAGGGSSSPPGYGTNVGIYMTAHSALAIDHSNALWIPSPGGFSRIGSDAHVTTTNLAGANFTSGVCVDSTNNLYYSAPDGNLIYRLRTNGVLEVFAGSGNPGSSDGNGIFTSFYYPTTMAADAADNIYVWDSENYLIRRINQNRDVRTIAGYNTGNSPSNVDGVGTNAAFLYISAMCADNDGDLIIACSGGSSIRKMTASTNVLTMAGSFGSTGYANGAGDVSLFDADGDVVGAGGVCFSQGFVFVADSGNQRIRQITFSPQPVGSGPNLSIATYSGVTVSGIVGRTYQVQSSPDMSSWTTLATLLLNSSPYLWIDQNPVSGNKFYRALLLP